MEETFTNKFSGIPFYRTLVSSPLKSFRVVYRETDLFVLAEKKLEKEVLSIVKKIRSPLEAFILAHPEFKSSRVPLSYPEKVPHIVKRMLDAGEVAGVGPMAAVAGAIAEEAGRSLVKKGLSSQVVVENGGDVFLWLKQDARVALFAGDSPFSGKLGLLIKKEFMPCGVCTSSGKIGHSLSLGKADAITVVHKDTAIADALATAFGNLLQTPQDFKKVIVRAEKIKGLLGVVGIIGDRLLLWGKELKILILEQKRGKL